ncbi:hypothetical protein [Azospirillum doebereinerae]
MLPIVTIDLPFLAREVNDAHSQVQYHAKGMLLEAKRAGEALLQAKGLCPRGTFDTWLTQNTRVKRAMAYRYMQVAERFTQLPSTAVDDLADVSIRDFLGIAEKKPQEPTQAPSTPPAFTREDAEYALKIHARVERGQDGERGVAESKLAKVAADFGMDAEALVTKAHELCPDQGLTDSEAARREAEELAKAAIAELARRDAILTEMKARYSRASKDELIRLIADWKAQGLLTVSL